MSIRGSFSFVPKDVVEWGRFFKSVAVETDPGSVTDDSFAPRTGLSVIGRAASTTGQPANITASGNGQFLGRRTDVVGFFALNDADIPASIARDSEVAAAITTHEGLADPHPGYTTAAELASAIATHAGLSDPHPGYLTAAEGNAAYAPIQTTGTYTGTFTGTTTDPTLTIRWSMVGAQVVLYIPQTSATSDDTAFTITGMSAGIRPTRAQTLLCRVQDNGAVSIGIVSIGTDGTLTFGLGVTGAVFTNSGTKGVELHSITYSRD